MKKRATRRTFLAAAVPAVALTTTASAAGEQSRGTKKVHRVEIDCIAAL